MREARDTTDVTAIKALAHPLRIRILEALESGQASPKALSDDLGESVGVVSYHVRMLADAGFVELVGTRPRRGATEHFYELVEKPVFSESLWTSLPAGIKDGLIRAMLRQSARDIDQAAEFGGFDRDDVHASRTPLVLDARGWSKLSKALDRLMEQAPAIERESKGRLEAGTSDEAFGARLIMMLFETPRRGRRR